MTQCAKCHLPLPEGIPTEECPHCLLALGLIETAPPFSGPLPSSADSASPPVAPGTRLKYVGDYELLEEIARGGMGVVFKARQRSLNRIVAVKMILAGRLASPAEIKRFHIEAEAAARLRHPGIVAIHEIGEHDGTHYFSMDYVEGKNLAQVVAEKGPLPALEAAAMLQAVAEAVQYAHDHGTLHRDLKPHNIVIDEQCRPHVTDFGLAKRPQANNDLTRTGAVFGTPAYMSPEQATGQGKEVGAATDIYALGGILYFALTGRPPFTAADPISLLRCVLETLPEKPRKINPGVAEDLENICLRALEKEPNRRYASAADFAKDLHRFINDEPVSARRPSIAARTFGWFHRHSWVGTALLIVGVVLLALLAYGFWEQTRFLVWQHAHPEFKRTPGALSKSMDKWGEFSWLLVLMVSQFLDYYIGKNYAGLIREGRYERVMRFSIVFFSSAMVASLFWIALTIRAHVWEAYKWSGVGTWCGVIVSFLGLVGVMRCRKELRLARLGQTPVEGCSPDEYQQLMDLQLSRSQEQTKELAREALLRGDHAKALKIVHWGRLGGLWPYSPEQGIARLKNELRAEGLLEESEATQGHYPAAPDARAKIAHRVRWAIFIVSAGFLIALVVSFFPLFRMVMPPKPPPSEHEVQTEKASKLEAMGSKAVPVLLEMLRSANVEEQSLAAQVFGHLGEQVVPALQAELRNERPDVRCWAAVGLGMIGAWEAVRDLIPLAEDADSRVRAAVRFALLRVPHTAATVAALVRMISLEPLEPMGTGYIIQDAETPALKICRLQPIWPGSEGYGLGYRPEPGTIYRFPASLFFELTVRNEMRRVFRSGDPSFVPVLAGLLSSPNHSLRSRAANALARTGLPAVPALVRALQTGDALSQENAGYTLGLLGRAALDAVPALLAFLSQREVSDTAHCHPCAAAVFALGAVGTNSIPGLLDLLRSDNRTASRYAAAALGKFSTNSALIIGPLSAALEDRRGHVRAGAVLALGQLGPSAAAINEALVKCLRDPDPKVAILATAALAAISPDPDNDSARLAAFLEHPEAAFRAGAIAALTKMKTVSPSAFSALRERLSDQDSDVRVKAVTALGKLGGELPENLAALRKSLRDPERLVRNYAALALGRIGAPAIPALIAETKDSDAEVRRWAVFALAHAHPDNHALAKVITLFADPSSEVRRAAAWGIGRALSDRRSPPDQAADLPAGIVPSLIALMADEEGEVRAAVVETLGQIRAHRALVLPALAGALVDPVLKVRRHAAFAQNRLNALTPEAIPVLEATLADSTAGSYEKNQARALLHKLRPAAPTPPKPTTGDKSLPSAR